MNFVSCFIPIVSGLTFTRNERSVDLGNMYDEIDSLFHLKAEIKPRYNNLTCIHIGFALCVFLYYKTIDFAEM